MKNLLLVLFLSFGFVINSQNVIEISLNQISQFSVYGKDSIHNMIKNSDLLHYTRIYEPSDLKFTIDKKSKTLHKYMYGILIDVVPIKKIEFKDSIYTFTITEKRDEMWANYEGQTDDFYLILDARKKQEKKEIPVFVYWKSMDIILNGESVEWCIGNVSDYVKIK